MTGTAFVYRTEKDNFDKNIFPYLQTITKKTLKEDNKDNQVIKVWEKGIIYIISSPMGIENKVNDEIRIITEECSKEINNNLEELTKTE